MRSMGTTSNEREETYREEARKYLAEVLDRTGWSANRAGQVIDRSHTTITRALKKLVHTSFENLQALEVASGVEIPEALKRANVANRLGSGPDQDQVASYLKNVLGVTEELQLAALEALSKKFAGRKA